MAPRPPVSGKKSKKLEQEDKHPQGMTRKLPSNNHKHNDDNFDNAIQTKQKPRTNDTVCKVNLKI